MLEGGDVDEHDLEAFALKNLHQRSMNSFRVDENTRRKLELEELPCRSPANVRLYRSVLVAFLRLYWHLEAFFDAAFAKAKPTI